MRRKLVFLIVAAILISWLTSAWLHRKNLQQAAKRERETRYTAVLGVYSKALRPGMTRKEVETYLGSANTQFSVVYTAFGGRRESQSADVIKIGEEEGSSWFCGKAYVYIAFEFLPLFKLHTDDTDTLERTEIHRVLDCP